MQLQPGRNAAVLQNSRCDLCITDQFCAQKADSTGPLLTPHHTSAGNCERHITLDTDGSTGKPLFFNGFWLPICAVHLLLQLASDKMP